MNVFLALLLVAAVCALSVTAILLVRRRAPEGGYFADGDRAAGVFGVLATGFSVLLGFIVFLAFESYDQSRSGAEQEALTVCSRSRPRSSSRGRPAGSSTGQLVCYGRSVVNGEWDRMRAGTQGDAINPGACGVPDAAVGAPRTDRAVRVRQAARSDLRAGGGAPDRIHGAVGVIPHALDRAVFHRRGDLRLHALLRRPRRARGRPGDADRIGRRR